MSSHEEWEEIAAGHALGALEPEDEQRFESHLRTCEDCRLVLADIEAVMAELAVAPDPVASPPELKARLMAAIQEDAAEPPNAAVSSPHSLEIIRDRKRSARETLADRWVRLAAAASVILLALIAAGVWSLGGSKSTTPRFVALQSVQSPSTQVATVELIGDRAWTISAGLSPNDAGNSQYVLWALPVTGSPVPIGSFDVAPGHTVSSLGKVSPPLSSVKAFAVSKEPGRTMPTTPTDVVASGALT